MKDEERMGQQGEALAIALGIRKARRPDGKAYDPPRYRLGKEYGTKTAVGVFLTIQSLWSLARMGRNEGMP